MSDLNAKQVERVNIAIAIECGWTQEKISGVWCDKGGRLNRGDYYSPPDYWNELNACRDAFLSLYELVKGDCWINLAKIVSGLNEAEMRDCSDNELFHADIANATASKRCEAFLKTVAPHKWDEITKENP